MTLDRTAPSLPFSPESEGAFGLVSGSGLDVFLFKAGVADWARALAEGSALDYGLFVQRDAPFFLVRARGLFELAVGVNFLAQPADRLQAFMDIREKGGCNLLLCGFPEPRILGDRRFCVREDVLREMREVGKAQIGAYADAGECAAAMALIMGRMDAGRMMQSTIMYPDQRIN